MGREQFVATVLHAAEQRVVAIVRGMKPRRLGRPRFGARAVVEAEAGSFERWSLRVGDELEVR